MDELLTAAQAAVELGKKHGASDVFATASGDRSVEFQMRDGKLERTKEATSRSLSLRVWADGRYSTNGTTDLRPERLDSFVAECTALTRALEVDPMRTVPDPALFAGRSDADLQLVDGTVRNVTREQRMTWLGEIDARIAGKDKVISATSNTWDGQSAGAMASSNGFAGGWESTNIGWSASVTVQDDGDKRPEGDWWSDALHQGDLVDRATVGDEALRRAHLRLGSVRGPTKKGLMIVENVAAGRLIGALLSPANGSSVQQGRSFWKGRLGEKLVHPMLAIDDEPLLVRGFGSRWFDGDGISSKSMPLVRDGALTNLYIDTYYGKKLGQAPTTGGASNRIVALGPRDFSTIVKDASDAIVVTSWLGGNSDPTTGDFSFGMRGHLVKDGVIGAPIGEMNVTGNLLTLFAGLVEVGSDPWLASSTRVPTLVFDGVQFSGT
jgi:PmbA protein